MADRKWNNQGGSNFDAFSGKYKKPKEQPNIPKFSDLDESNSTSFNYKVPPKPKPQYGNFGDAIWTYSPVDDNPTPYAPFADLTPKDPRIPTIKEKTPVPPIPKTDPVTKSTDLFPYTVFDEYEIVVKFGLMVLRISSGQAYAARQGFNDPKYDFAIVIKSSDAISLGGNSASTVNLISVSNSAQNPIYSLYNWLQTKISIATNNDATGSDPVLSGIAPVENVAQLPSTQFVSNGLACGLFYAEGIQPDQICLNATNKVFKFEPSVNTNPTWTVTYPGEILPLCLDINKLQIVSIKLVPSTLNAINRGSGNKFKLRLARDSTIAQLAGSLEVDIRITSPELLLFSQQLDPTLYTTTNINNVAIQQISATIPALAEFVDVTIKPLSDPTKLVDVPLKVEIISSWVPDTTADYSINALFFEVDMTVKPQLPVASINFAPDIPTSLPPNVGSFVVRVSIDQVMQSNLSVNIDLSGTAAGTDYTINGLSIGAATILAGSLFADVTITPIANSTNPPANETITLTLIPDPAYTIGLPSSVTATIATTNKSIVLRTIISPNEINPQVLPISVTGSNVSTSQISNSTAYQEKSIFTEPSPSIKILIDDNNAGSFAQNYGQISNYHGRFRGAFITEYIVSIRLIKAWALFENVRYIVVSCFRDIIFDTGVANQFADQPVPIPNRSFPDDLSSVSTSFGSIEMPASGYNPAFFAMIPLSENLGAYPDGVMTQFGSANIKPIQLDVFNYRTRDFENTPLYIRPFRSAIYQAAIEFDLLTDPDLENPTIINVVSNTTVAAMPPLPATENTKVAVFVFPYQQLS